MQVNAKPAAAPGDGTPGSEEPALIKMNNQHSKLDLAMPMNDMPTTLSESISQVLDDLPVAQSKNSAPAGYLKSKDASSIRAVVLIGVAAAFCATFVTKPCVASKLAELHNPVACPPQWLPVLVASNSHETSAVWRVMLLLCSAAAAVSPPADAARGTRIFGFLMEGCSGSSFVTQTTRALLDCHLPHTSSATFNGELLKREAAREAMQAMQSLWQHHLAQDAFYTDDDKGAALKEGDPNWWASFLQRLDSWAFSLNKTVVINADLHSGSADISSWAPTMHRLGVPFVLAWRTNVLDRTLCVIRDCFNNKMGRRVDNVTRDCMARRQKTGNPIVVRIDVPALQRSLFGPMGIGPMGMGPSSSLAALLLKHGLGGTPPVDTSTPAGAERLVPAPLVEYEDLAAFQYFRANETDLLAKSIHAWSSLLTGWGVAHTTESVSHCLRQNFDTRPWPQPHRPGVENADAVVELLHDLGPKYEAMWRTSLP